MQHIGLVDCNNFFVSCERLFRPDLLGKPVVVLSSNDGCVIARSQEIKDKGIPMGVPYFQIKDTLHEMKAVMFSTHFALYRDISRRVFEVVRSSFSNVEQYSIDECFFTFESDEPEVVAAQLKKQVEQLVGIPVSVGVASSKTRAKYANRVAKKTGGVAVFDEAKWNSEIEIIKLSDIWGVGAGRSRQFKEKGIHTVSDLLRVDKLTLAKLFGIEGVRLQSELAGTPVLAVRCRQAAQKSLTSSRSFAKTTTDIDVLTDAILYHLHQVAKDLDSMDLLATSMRVLIAPSRHGDFALHGASEEVVLTAATRDLFALEKVAGKLLMACYKSNIPYKKAGIVLSGLVSPVGETKSLFVDDKVLKKDTEALSATIFAINKKHGKALLQLGRAPEKAAVWEVKKEAISPSYTTNWSELKVVHS